MSRRFFRTVKFFCLIMSFCLVMCSAAVAAGPLKTIKTTVLKTSWTSESEDVMAVHTKNGRFLAYQTGNEDYFNKIYGITIESICEKKMVLIRYQDEPDGRIIKEIKLAK